MLSELRLSAGLVSEGGPNSRLVSLPMFCVHHQWLDYGKSVLGSCESKALALQARACEHSRRPRLSFVPAELQCTLPERNGRGRRAMSSASLQSSAGIVEAAGTIPKLHPRAGDLVGVRLPNCLNLGTPFSHSLYFVLPF